MDAQLHKHEVNLKDAGIFGALGNSRTYFQYKNMYDFFAEGMCNFCHLDELKFPPIIRRGNWIVKKCDMPYANCEHHLIIVYANGHVTDWKKLSREDKADYMEIIEDAEEMFNIEGCAIVSRRGAIRRHAGTMTHIHGHIMVAALDENGIPVGGLRAYFAKTREELEYCSRMVELFERVRTGNLSGVRKGHVILDSNGKYLSRDGSWNACSEPIKADMLETPLEQISKHHADKEKLQYYEVMVSDETGLVLMDGPTKLEAM